MMFKGKRADDGARCAQREQTRENRPMPDVNAVENANAQQEIGTGFIVVDGADDAHCRLLVRSSGVLALRSFFALRLSENATWCQHLCSIASHKQRAPDNHAR